LIEGEYYKVVTDGDTQNNVSEMIFNEGMKLPIYIKPHGTVSHKSTMKFTGEDYFGLPRDIEDLIRVLVSGRVSHHKSESESKGENERIAPVPVNLIVVGFNMQSFEFNSILESMPSNSNIYFFSPSDPSNKLDESLKKYYSPRNFFEVERGHEEIDFTLDDWMLRLWNQIERKFEPKYRPRRIIRHEFISKIFSNKNEIRTNKEIREYLQDRTYIELAMSIAKYKGFLSIPQLAKDRFGKYFSFYKNQSGKKESIIDLCKKFGFEDYAYASKALVSKREGLSTTANKASTLTFKASEIDGHFFEQIFASLDKREVLSAATRKRLKEEEVKNSLKATLQALVEDQDKEVCPKFDYLYDNIFSTPKVITTELALSYCTRFYLKKLDWNYLLIIAESGEWIIRSIEESLFRDRTLKVIIADDAFIEQLRNKLSANKKSEIKLLHWWEHNQHMTIFINKSPTGEMKILKSIYFTRRLRTCHINPLILDKG